jgi:chromosome segregation ATPase
MSLKEALDFLNDAAPALPEQMAALLEDSAELKAQAGQLIAAFEAKRSEGDQLVSQCRQSLDGLKEAADSQLAQVREATEAVEDKVEESANDLAEAGDRIRAAADSAGQEMEGLQAGLGEAANATQAAEEQVGSAVQTVRDAIGSGRDELQGALDQAANEAAALAQAAGESKELVSGALDALRSRMKELLGQAQGRIAETVGHLQELQAAHEEVLSREAGHLGTGATEFLDELGEGLDGDVKERIGAGVDEVIAALGALAQDLQDASARAEAGRGEVEAAFEALEETAAPFPGYVDSVKAAAQQASLEWA